MYIKIKLVSMYAYFLSSFIFYKFYCLFIYSWWNKKKSKTNIIVDGYGVWPSGFGIWYKHGGNTNGGGGENIINFPGSGKRGGGANINRECKSSLEKVCIEN
jgi:hypothetical protein